MPRFAVRTRVHFGEKGNRDAVRELVKEGRKEILVFVDSQVAGLGATTTILSEYEASGLSLRSVRPVDVREEPTYGQVDAVAAEVRGVPVDAILAIGGGSVMDLGKAVGILMTNPGKAMDYRGMDRVPSPGIPVICYPTTAGTGSEVTHTASLIDEGSQVKLGINGRHVSPHMAVLVPELLFTCPRSVTISSGLDALVHAIEAVTSGNANRITSMLGTAAFALVYAGFCTALGSPADYRAREDMLLGAYYAGMAMLNAGGGPASGISYPLGTRFHVPHGIAGGIFLPHVIALNVGRGYTGYTPLHDALPGADRALTDGEKAVAFAELFADFYRDIQGPRDLSRYGVTKSDIPALADIVLEQRMENLRLSPVPVGREDVVALLGEVIT